MTEFGEKVLDVLAEKEAAALRKSAPVAVSIDRLEPAGDRLFVEPLVVEKETTAGGIIIPEQAKQKPVFGTVTHVGPGPWHDTAVDTPAPAAVGDVVLYGKYAGTEIEALGRKILALRGTDVVAVQRHE